MKSLRDAGDNWNISAHCHGLSLFHWVKKIPSWGTGKGLFVFYSKNKATNLVACAGADAMG
jgi:hypothetical protein